MVIGSQKEVVVPAASCDGRNKSVLKRAINMSECLLFGNGTCHRRNDIKAGRTEHYAADVMGVFFALVGNTAGACVQHMYIAGT